jgi:hypothetical protein
MREPKAVFTMACSTAVAVGLFAAITVAARGTGFAFEKTAVSLDKGKNACVYNGQYHLRQVELSVSVSYVEDLAEYRALEGQWREAMAVGDESEERRLRRQTADLVTHATVNVALDDWEPGQELPLAPELFPEGGWKNVLTVQFEGKGTSGWKAVSIGGLVTDEPLCRMY